MTTLYHIAPQSARAAITEQGLLAYNSHDRWTLRSEPITGVFGWVNMDAARKWASRDGLMCAHEDIVDVWAFRIDEDELCIDPQVELETGGDYRFSRVACVEGINPEDMQLLGSLPSGAQAETAQLIIADTVC